MLRLLGVLPLGFFVARVVVLQAKGALPDALWMCNLGSLGLALGLLCNQPKVIRPAALWLALGFPFWLSFALSTETYELTSILNHAGSLTVALVALAIVRFKRAVWSATFLASLVLQILSRFITPPEMNVNAAHNLRFTMVENTGMPYWQFWIGNTLLGALAFYLLSLLFARLFPDTEGATVATSGATASSETL